MKKIFKIIFITLFISSYSMAQNDMSLMYSNHFPLATSRYQPTKLGEGFKSVEIILPGILLPTTYAYSGNSVVSVGDIISASSNGGDLKNGVLEKLYGRMENKNFIGVGNTTTLLGIAIKLKTKDGDQNNPNDLKIAFSYEAALRTGFVFQYPKDVFDLVIKGNKAYAGKTATLSPSLNANSFLEHAIGFAMPLPLKLIDKLTFKIAGRVKFMQGIAALSMPKGQLSLYTAADGRYLDLNSNIEINTAAPESSGSKFTGTGAGIDLGITATYDNKLSGTLSILDIGAIKYTKNIKGASQNTTYRYEGVAFGDVINSGIGAVDYSKIEKDLKPSSTSNPFTMNLPSRVVLQGEYMINKETPKGRPYKWGNVFATYIQGFNNQPGAATKPFVSVGYSQSVRTCLNVGTNVAYGGYNDLMTGLFASVRGGFFRFGVGTSNILPVFGLGYGTDVSIRSTISF